MIRNSNVKKAVLQAAGNTEFGDNTEMLMTCCVLYKFLFSLMENNDAEANNLRETAESYITLYRDKIQKLKSTYISYRIMRNIIENSSRQNFLVFSEALINEVYQAYNNRVRIEPFSVANFSQYMYSVASTNWKQLKRLSAIHYNIMSPIAKYYKDKYNISPKKLQIYNAEGIADNPGKEIIFFISGVPSTKILGDLVSKRINAKYYSVSLEGDYVRLVTE